MSLRVYLSTLNNTGVQPQQDLGIPSGWTASAREMKVKGERKRLIFFGAQRGAKIQSTFSPEWRRRAPFQLGLRSPGRKVNSESLCAPGNKPEKKRSRKRETARDKEWHGEAKLWWSRVCSFIFKGSFYTLSCTFPDVKDTKSCRVSSTLQQFDLHRHQDVFCIPFHLQGSLCYVHYLLAQRPINIFVTLSW